MKEIYIIEIERPHTLTITEVKDYIKTAIDRYNKGGNPDSPLWNIKTLAVKKNNKRIGSMSVF